MEELFLGCVAVFIVFMQIRLLIVSINRLVREDDEISLLQN